MKNKITSFESIMEASNNLVELSRNIISYFTTNDQFDAVLADDSSQECHILDLAVRYLDNDNIAERDKIAFELESHIAKYCTNKQTSNR